MATEFKGFPAQTTAFYRELTENNNKIWFDANKSDYQDYVQAPAQVFVAELGTRLQKLSRDVEFDTRLNGSGSVIRIYRDVRFSKDKTPYKNWLGIIFWATPGKRMRTPAYYFGLEHTGARFHVGWHGFDKPVLTAYREAVDSATGARLAKILAAIKEIRGFSIESPHYKQVPRGYEKDHPRADLLRYNSMGASSPLISPAKLKKGDLIDLCMDYAETLKPLYQWLSKLNSRIQGAS